MESSYLTCHNRGMVKIVTSEELAELKRLKSELPNAIMAAAPPRTLPPAHEMEGEPLARWIAAEKRVSDIQKRIKQIEGD